MNDVPNFVKDVPRVPKCVPRRGSDPKHFLMGSKMKSWVIHVQMGALETIVLDVPNLMKGVPKFVKDVPRVPNCVPRWGSAPNHFLMGSQMKLWTLGDKIGVLEEIGWDQRVQSVF